MFHLYHRYVHYFVYGDKNITNFFQCIRSQNKNVIPFKKMHTYVQIFLTFGKSINPMTIDFV